MKHKNMLTIFQFIAVFGVGIGSVLNWSVISMNRGMPIIGRTTSFGRYVPINQGTKLVFLADIIRAGNYILSVGDLFVFTGIFACLMTLWIALSKVASSFHL
jgi:hypothetical protein